MNNKNRKAKKESSIFSDLFPTPYTLHHTPRQSGFTMIELLVTVSIFMMITSALLVNYPKFSAKILLENTAHLIGLSIREAQTYGLNVRATNIGGQDEFPSYGVHFSLSGITPDDDADNKHFVLFADFLPIVGDPTNNDKLYNAISNCSTSGGECVELFSIESAEQIYLLCGGASSVPADDINNWNSYSGADCTLGSLDVAYTRPDPDARIQGYSFLTGEIETFADGEIVVRSPRGEYKMIVVSSTGQISVQ